MASKSFDSGVSNDFDFDNFSSLFLDFCRTISDNVQQLEDLSGQKRPRTTKIRRKRTCPDTRTFVQGGSKGPPYTSADCPLFLIFFGFFAVRGCFVRGQGRTRPRMSGKLENYCIDEKKIKICQNQSQLTPHCQLGFLHQKQQNLFF